MKHICDGSAAVSINAEERSLKTDHHFFRFSLFALLLLFFFLQCVLSMTRLSATSDEVAHLPAGYTYLKTGDFRLNPEHPPLIKIISAYPLLLFGLPSPETNKYYLENDKWEYGKSLIYDSGVGAGTIMFWGRIVIVFLGLFLGILVYGWAKELFGGRAALFSLFLFAFEPNLIANSTLVTTDLGFALFFLLFFFWMWRYFRNPSPRALIICGAASGFAFATKFSALLMAPIAALLFIIEFFSSLRQGSAPKKRLIVPHLLFLFIVPALTCFIVAASYGFINIRYYFIGLRSVSIHGTMGHAAFLAGSYSDTGWWYYFPLALLIKTPLPLLIFFSASIVCLIAALVGTRINRENEKESVDTEGKDLPAADTHRALTWKDLSYIVIPPFLFFLASMMGRLNIGLRHVLPIFPFVIMISGAVIVCSCFKTGTVSGGAGFRRRASKKIFVTIFLILSLWYLAAAVFIFPHELSYFNELIGGPSNGYKYLVDSNLDWGQDLPLLKEFLEKNKIDGVILSYFGNAEPAYYGIDYEYLPICGKAKIPSTYHPSLKDFDFIAISATNLQAVFTAEHQCFKWLKERKPYARIAYSIFVYDVRGDSAAQEQLSRIYADSGMMREAERHRLRAEQLRKERSGIRE